VRKESKERWAYRDFQEFQEASAQMEKMGMQVHLARMDQWACEVCRAILVPLASAEPQAPLVPPAQSACVARQAKKVPLVPLAHRVRAAMQDHRVQLVMLVLSDPEALLVSQVRMVRMVSMDSLEPKESVAISGCRVCEVLLGLQGHKASKVRREKKVGMVRVDSKVFKAPKAKLVLLGQEAQLVVATLGRKVHKASKARKATRDHLVPVLEAPLDPLAPKARGANLARMDQRVIQVHQALKGLLVRMV